MEIKPIKNKKVSVYLIKKPKKSINFHNLRCLVDILMRKKINFISIDVEDDDLKNFRSTLMGKMFEELNVPFYPVYVPEYAKGYLHEEIFEKEEQLNELLEEYLAMKNHESIKGQNLKSWVMVLEDEIREKKALLKLKVKPKWIVKKILDLINPIQSEEVSCIHLSQGIIFSEIARLLNDLNVEVIALQRTNEFVAFNIITNQEEIKEWKY